MVRSFGEDTMFVLVSVYNVPPVLIGTLTSWVKCMDLVITHQCKGVFEPGVI
uniref:Uncharacterized protein n=1 Tax=Aegilops tauschii subsp. strangulata TaxID=200361 RepID=A0A453M6D6_AEGTS